MYIINPLPVSSGFPEVSDQKNLEESALESDPKYEENKVT